MSSKAEVVKYSTLIAEYNQFTNQELVTEFGDFIVNLPIVDGESHLQKLALLNTIMLRLAGATSNGPV